MPARCRQCSRSAEPPANTRPPTRFSAVVAESSCTIMGHAKGPAADTAAALLKEARE